MGVRIVEGARLDRDGVGQLEGRRFGVEAEHAAEAKAPRGGRGPRVDEGLTTLSHERSRDRKICGGEVAGRHPLGRNLRLALGEGEALFVNAQAPLGERDDGQEPHVGGAHG